MTGKFFLILVNGILACLMVTFVYSSAVRQIGNLKIAEEKLYADQTEDSDGNPFLWPCNESTTCLNGLGCMTYNGPNSTYWSCDCWAGGDIGCTHNYTCCTNICNPNGICSSTGGTQGTYCLGDVEACADEYECVPWGKQGGYCNYVGPQTNPFLNPCTSNRDCNNTIHQCSTNNGPDSAYWYCACYCGGGPCKTNSDCSTNICNNGVCASTGGTQGSICSTDCGSNNQCATGYVCESWGDVGYCNRI